MSEQLWREATDEELDSDLPQWVTRDVMPVEPCEHGKIDAHRIKLGWRDDNLGYEDCKGAGLGGSDE